MKITDDKLEKLQDTLSKQNVHCSHCGSRNFTLVDRLFELREFNGGNIVLGPQNSVIPVAVLLCLQCGEMKLLSGIKLGLVDNSEKMVNEDDSSK